MSAVLQAPRELIESFAELRLPPRLDARLQWLMDRNSDGLLQDQERDDLESLVELSETIGLHRARALEALGRQPS